MSESHGFLLILRLNGSQWIKGLLQALSCSTVGCGLRSCYGSTRLKESTKDSQLVEGNTMDTGGLGISSYKGHNQEVLGEIDLD